jgi:HD-like signal output (HDOD) protein
MLSTEQILRTISRMPPISPVAHRIAELLARPRQSVKELAEAVQVDPVVTAQVLKVSNSAYFSLPVKVVSIPHAINMLGANRLADIVLMSNSRALMQGDLKGYGLARGELWEQSLATALIARGIALRCRIKRTSLLFTAGLLKDLGKVVLDRFIGDVYGQINDLVVNSDLSQAEAEKAVLGFDFLDVSVMIAEKWQFPQSLVAIIRACRVTDTTDFKDPAPAVVYLAGAVALMPSAGDALPERAARHFQAAQAALELETATLEELGRASKAAVRNYREMLADG